MNDLYQKILNKPEIYRQRLAYIITAIIGVVVFSIWLPQTMKSIKATVNLPGDEDEAIQSAKSTLPSLQLEKMENFDASLTPSTADMPQPIDALPETTSTAPIAPDSKERESLPSISNNQPVSPTEAPSASPPTKTIAE